LPNQILKSNLALVQKQSSSATQLYMFDWFNKKDGDDDKKSNNPFDFFNQPVKKKEPEPVATKEVPPPVEQESAPVEASHVPDQDVKVEEKIEESVVMEDPVVVEEARPVQEETVAATIEEVLVPEPVNDAEEVEPEKEEPPVVAEKEPEPVQIETTEKEEPILVTSSEASVDHATHEAHHPDEHAVSVDEHAIHSGKVKWFAPQRGYGFIVPHGGSPNDDIVFVHQSEIQYDGFRCLYAREEVEYRLVTDDQGRSIATHVTGPNGGALKGESRQTGNWKSFPQK